MKNPNNKWLSVCLLCLTICVVACQKKMDDYKKYIEGDPVITYTGKLDSVKVYPGRNRVLITGLLVSDPKIIEARIYWNSRRDSLSVPIVRSGSVDTLKTYISNLAEGIYNFEFVTFDALGNRSVRVFESGRVYGDNYIMSLINRPVQSSTITAYDNSLSTTFGNLDRNSGIFATELSYTDLNGNSQLYRLPIELSSGVIENVSQEASISYRSLYLPDTLCIDTFYTVYKDIHPNTVYFRNMGAPFTGINISGRWGVLEHWTTNAGANPHNSGVRGSWDNNTGTGVLAFESGWSYSSHVVNGKIYQTSTLKAGKWRVNVEYVRNNDVPDTDPTSLVYFVVSDDGTIPNSADVASSDLITYHNLKYVSGSYTTASYEFDNPSLQQITIGFVCNFTNAANQYFNVKSITVEPVD